MLDRLKAGLKRFIDDDRVIYRQPREWNEHNMISAGIARTDDAASRSATNSRLDL